MGGMMMSAFPLMLPEELDARLSMASVIHGKTKAEIIYEALQDYLSKLTVPSDKSFAELAEKYLGCAEGGPADLSTNKKHLEGYGQR
jgi:predicted DNA-binding protein